MNCINLSRNLKIPNDIYHKRMGIIERIMVQGIYSYQGHKNYFVIFNSQNCNKNSDQLNSITSLLEILSQNFQYN